MKLHMAENKAMLTPSVIKNSQFGFEFLLDIIFIIVLISICSFSVTVKAEDLSAKSVVVSKCGAGVDKKFPEEEKTKFLKGEKMKLSAAKNKINQAPESFSDEEVRERLTKILAIEDDFITKECVESIFNVNLYVSPLEKGEKRDPLLFYYRISPNPDLKFAVNLSIKEHSSTFWFIFTPAFATHIRYNDFREIAEYSGWVYEDGLDTSRPDNIPEKRRDTYLKRNKNMILLVDLEPRTYYVKSMFIINN